MIRFATALVLAALAHVASFAFASCFLASDESPSADLVPELELASVELSFSDRDDAEGVVGSPAQLDSPPPVPPPVESMLDPLPELPVQEDALMPTTPPVQVESRRLEPPVLEVPPPEEVPSKEVESQEFASVETPSAESTRETAQVDVPPQTRTAFRPIYPRGCRARHEEGVVTLLISVADDGHVESVAVAESSGVADLDAAAVAAARRAVFTPAFRNGQTVAGSVRVPIAFRLRP